MREWCRIDRVIPLGKRVSELALIAALFSFLAMAVQAGSRPNIVFIIADDMAWNDSGAYGNPYVHTPNIDRLAQEGMCFDQAFLTISSCSPSRASIITGRYPHQTDAEQLHWPLPAEQLTFVELLKASGYWTAAAGKWHLGGAVKDRFDEVREADVSGFQLPTGEAAKAGRIIQKAEGDAKSGCDQWLPTLWARPKDRPFFLWLAALDPHRDYDEGILTRPHRPETVRLPPYVPDTPGTRADFALYYDEITRLDRFIGEVMAELKKQGVAGNTFVLFISDNGRPFPRDKTTIYDSGIKAPFIVRWPSRVKPASRCGSLVSAVDIAPAFLELAGLPAPDLFEGASFLPLLRDPELNIRDHVFAERNWHDYEDRVRAVRDRRFKYIRNFYPDLPNTPPADVVRSPSFREMIRLRSEGRLPSEGMNLFIKPRPTEELYDSWADPHKTRNLAGDPAHTITLNRLRRELARWQQATDDTEPPFRTLDEFDRETGLALPVRVRPRPSKAQMMKQFEKYYRKKKRVLPVVKDRL